MGLCGVAAHDENTVAVLHVDEVIGHGTPAIGFGQGRNRTAVAEAGLMFDIDEAEGSHQGLVYPAFLVVEGGASDRCNGLRAVDELTGGIGFDKGGVPGFLHALSDAVNGPIPGDFFPFVGKRRPVHRGQQPVCVFGESF